MADSTERRAATASSVDLFRHVLRAEADAIVASANQLGPEVDGVVDLLLGCQGRVVFTGLGKTGYVARKAAATFCSTGTPAIYLHPTEALHGDLGIVTENDVMIAISNSGETAEVVDLLPFVARLGVPVIAITGNLNSALAARARLVIDAGVEQEADQVSGAPTSSATVAMAMCDAIAITLMRHRGFTREQFAIFHPGGNLGRKLLLKVSDLMCVGQSIPVSNQETPLSDAMEVMSDKKLGAVFVVDRQQTIMGILTDGDLRRIFQKSSAAEARAADLQRVSEFMTRKPKTVSPDALGAEALRLMEKHSITVLGVADGDQRLVGAIHLHDLIRAGLA